MRKDVRERLAELVAEGKRILSVYAALEGLLDGLDANGDPERCGLSQEQWDRRIAAARSALEVPAK
jgi:hypothetical protein